ncbi:MAG TPA: LapD/MoxY N-terminal periplasmic domain-containing protein [Polaromonas sp.]|uniref:bifunctional diguanylate cyclase/phosphodiesterase n=1 Tax=Polaromonas sp. TaxID=1869339 RepID=UPI002D5677A5|nr:LapD/MoxY N-terminal periplasmic domain-containing protein [Polaromonas sp.]HYW58207.1 LapD/MoxY N-terminal periplasmic domain-containing protein [Polaromonas sp.]
MSMYRQLWLAIILSTLMALLGGLLASTLNARNYLSEQLSSKNSDNAASLALALSQQSADSVIIELTVAALFDGGHYELIRVIDPTGQTMVERVARQQAKTVPDWFMKVLPLSAAPGQAQISNGWKQLGTLTLISTSRFAYESLWKNVLQLVAALGLAGMVAGYLGTLVLRRLREPLQRVIDQANAISDRRFELIEVPDVPELKQLAIAMNSTVSRLKGMFAEEAQRLEVLRVTANYDTVTGLANRTFFLIQLLDTLDSEEAADGSLLLIRLADFSRRSQRLGPQTSQDMLKAFAAVLSEHATRLGGVAARIGDSDFALLLPSQSPPQDVGQSLLTAFSKALTPLHGEKSTAYIGIGKLQRGQDMAGLMAEASAALAIAQAEGTDAIRMSGSAAGTTAPDDADATARAIKLALEQGRARLASFPVLDLQGQLVHRECPLELKLDEDDDWQAVTRFRHVTEPFNLSPLIDLTAVRLALEKLRGQPGLTGVSLQLSAASLGDTSFNKSLLTLLKTNAALANRLSLEMPEADAIKNPERLRTFVTQVRKSSGRVGLKHFGRDFSHVGVLHDMGLDFVKVDSSFIRGLQYSADNQVFLKGLAKVAHKMGMQVYAEGVIDRAELAALEAASFDGAAGPAMREAA